MTSQIIDVALGTQKLLRWVPEGLEILWIAFWSMIGAVIVLPKRSPTTIMFTLALALGVLFVCCGVLLLNQIWLIALAPALGLMFSATIALAYRRN